MTTMEASLPPTSLQLVTSPLKIRARSFEGDVIQLDVSVHDRAHADNAHAVVGNLLDVRGILDLFFSEDVGVADLDSTLDNLGDASAGATALDGDLNARVLFHEQLGGSLAKRLQRSRANSGNGAGQLGSGAALGAGSGAGSRAARRAAAAATTNQAHALRRQRS